MTEKWIKLSDIPGREVWATFREVPTNGGTHTVIVIKGTEKDQLLYLTPEQVEDIKRRFDEYLKQQEGGSG